MMPRVTIRGLLISCSALLAFAAVGCAEPEQEPAHDSSQAAEQGGTSGESFNVDVVESRAKGKGVDDDRGTKKGRPLESVHSGFAPDAERAEPDPVPWVPRHVAAHDG